MARPASFNKRETEKKKASKREEKQKRKEERKANGTASMDDMIAYVDENGNFSSTPPEKQDKEEIKLEEIDISIPKKEIVEPEALKGRIEFFNPEKGFGFVKDLGSAEKYFFHISSAPLNIAQNNIVSFELERGKRGMNAVRIEFFKEA